MGKCCSKRTQDNSVRILMLGLDGAGKTTILYQLKYNETVKTIPTIGFNVETLDYGDLAITAWDVGGQDKIRVLWKHYFLNTDAVIFVVNSQDRDRLEDAKEEIKKLASEKCLKNCSFLIMANKQDLNNSLPPGEICELLDMGKLKKIWLVQATSGVTGHGLKESMDWIKDNYRKCQVCKERLTFRLDCNCYICKECAFKENIRKARKNNPEIKYKKISVCPCGKELTNGDFNAIFTKKKIEDYKKENHGNEDDYDDGDE